MHEITVRYLWNQFRFATRGCINKDTIKILTARFSFPARFISSRLFVYLFSPAAERVIVYLNPPAHSTLEQIVLPPDLYRYMLYRQGMGDLHEFTRKSTLDHSNPRAFISKFNWSRNLDSDFTWRVGWSLNAWVIRRPFVLPPGSDKFTPFRVRNTPVPK